MNIPKAIERLENLDTNCPSVIYRADNKAIRLGIEALKEIQNVRKISRYSYTPTLPSETED